MPVMILCSEHYYIVAIVTANSLMLIQRTYPEL